MKSVVAGPDPVGQPHAAAARGKDAVVMHTVVERELELGLVLSPDSSIPVPALLAYRTDDPFAVHITFHIGSDHPIHWTFARELLIEGVFRPTGDGDVRVWPITSGVLCMALSSPGGYALLEAPIAAVSAWLERTLRLVPAGTEPALLALDDALRDLLAPAPSDELWPWNPWLSDDSPEAGA